MTKEEIEAAVASLGAAQPWSQNIQLPYGIETRPGVQHSHARNLNKWTRIRPLLEDLDLRGRRILDVGCGEGFFAFEATKLGASVVGIDADADRVAKAQFAAGLLAGNEQTRFECTNLYSDTVESLGRFDICLCLGVLHRVPDPFSALSRLSGIADVLILEWKALTWGHHDEPIAHFWGGEYVQEDYYGTQYWLPSCACVERMLTRAGLSRFHRHYDPSQKRAILVAGRDPQGIFARPDVIVRSSRIRAFFRHTKRYLKTLRGIADGSLNS